MTREREYWFGQIISDKELLRNDLEIVESLIVFFWQPHLNDLKKKFPPEPIIVINRWYDKNEKLRMKKIHEGQKLDDVIFWDGKVWHTGHLRISI